MKGSCSGVCNRVRLFSFYFVLPSTRLELYAATLLIGAAMANVHEPVVVPLAWRNKKTPPTTHRVERMTYPELSADVLHLIAEYLSFSDRLNLSLVSKAFHSIVYQITELVCSDAVQLSRLREYLYADPADRVRGRRLVSLSLHFMTLPKPGDEYGTRCLTMLLEVLQRTTNLRRLSIDNDSRWTEVFSRDPLRGILSRLHSLSYLRVEAPIQEYILNPGLYPTSLRKVHLSAHDGRVLAFQALCRVMGQLDTLEDLTLESFPESNSAYLDMRDGITVLKSIRKLTLISTWLPLGSPQSLPAIFPSVHTMTLIHCDLNTPSWTTYEYPSLHRVHCHYDTRSRLEYVVNFPYDVRVMSIVIRRQDDFMVSVPNPDTMVGMVFRAPCTWWNVQSSCRWSQFECIDKDMAETLSLLVSHHTSPPGA